MVNGSMTVLPVKTNPAHVTPKIDGFPRGANQFSAPHGWRDVLQSRGPEGFAKAVSTRKKLETPKIYLLFFV